MVSAIASGSMTGEDVLVGVVAINFAFNYTALAVWPSVSIAIATIIWPWPRRWGMAATAAMSVLIRVGVSLRAPVLLLGVYDAIAVMIEAVAHWPMAREYVRVHVVTVPLSDNSIGTNMPFVSVGISTLGWEVLDRLSCGFVNNVRLNTLGSGRSLNRERRRFEERRSSVNSRRRSIAVIARCGFSAASSDCSSAQARQQMLEG